jgi:HSP20 family protein
MREIARAQRVARRSLSAPRQLETKTAEGTPMFEEIDTTIQSVERLYRAVSGRDVANGDATPLPPEKDAVQHVEGQLDRLLQRLGTVSQEPEARAWAPPVTVLEKHDALVVCVDLPGVRRDQVSVACNAVSLMVSGRRVIPTEGIKLQSTEAPLGTFQRQIALPPGALVQELTATMKDGVLEITVPRTSLNARPVTVQ